MDINELKQLCSSKVDPTEEPLEESSFISYKKIWKKLIEWLEEHQINEFSTNEIEEFALAKLGGTTRVNIPSKYLTSFAGLNSLKNYILHGKLRIDCSHIEYQFDGELGVIFKNFLSESQLKYSLGTMLMYNRQLHFLFKSLQFNNMQLCDINFGFIENLILELCAEKKFARANMKSSLRIFFRWCYTKGFTDKDLSKLVTFDKKIVDEKIPTTFTADECQRILLSIDRSSQTGKRDYAILLCISVYGWRSGDVCNLKLQDIDWKNNVMSFVQDKTKVPAEFPLHPAIGNAIIDYLKNARPQSNYQNVFVSLYKKNKGNILRSTTIFRILQKYIRRGNITDINKRKHGPHALRFSLATALITECEASIELTKSILGHKNTQTSMNYIKLNIDMLKKCSLPMPICKSPFYIQESLE